MSMGGGLDMCSLFSLLCVLSGVVAASRESDDAIAQVRLSFGTSASSEVVVSWVTKAEDAAEVVFWAVEPGRPWADKPRHGKLVQISTTKYLKKTDWPYIHSAKLRKLRTGSRYAYYIRSDRWEGRINTFETAPGPDSPASFLVFSDMSNTGSEHTIRAVKHEVATGSYTSVLHLGDIAYDLHHNNGKRGDQFFDMMEPIASTVPYMTCPGNHERRNKFLQYSTRFIMPTPAANPRAIWYSWDVGLTHFVSLASDVFIMAREDEEFAEMAKEQVAWLAQDLAKANRNRTRRPWIVVYGHRPLYCSNSGRGRDCNRAGSRVRYALESLFLKHGVDLYLCGHNHAYERSWPTIYGQPVWQGPETAGSHPAPPSHLRFSGDPLAWGIQIPVDSIAGEGESVERRPGSSAPEDEDTPILLHDLPGMSIHRLLNSSLHDTYVNPRGPVYITNGLAGVFKGDEFKMDGFSSGEAPWSVLRFTDSNLLGYSRLVIQNTTHLTIEQVRAVDGRVLDTLTMIQDQHRSFMPDSTSKADREADL